MMSFLTGSRVPPPPTAAVASVDTQTEADKAAEEVRKRARKAGAGRQSTILTNPLGGTSAPAVAPKTLLGS